MSDEKQDEVPCVYSAQLRKALESLKNVSGKNYVEILTEKDVIPEDIECSQCGNIIAAIGMQQAKARFRTYDLDAWTHQFLPVIFKEEMRAAERENQEEQWFLHLCKQYFYDKPVKKVKFFWNFNVYSHNIELAVRDICRLIDMFVSQLEELDIPAPVRKRPRERKTAMRAQSKRGASTDERNFFEDKMRTGTVVEHGRVVSIPLVAGANRNVPEGSLFEKGKSPKGAHFIGGQ